VTGYKRTAILGAHASSAFDSKDSARINLQELTEMYKTFNAAN
jgi:hypothetical protein